MASNSLARLLDMLFISRVLIFYLAFITVSCDILFFRYDLVVIAAIFTVWFFDLILLFTIIFKPCIQQKLWIITAFLSITSLASSKHDVGYYLFRLIIFIDIIFSYPELPLIHVILCSIFCNRGLALEDFNFIDSTNIWA